jgi:hypothetical protein
MCASICRVTHKVLDRTKRRGEISAVNQNSNPNHSNFGSELLKLTSILNDNLLPKPLYCGISRAGFVDRRDHQRAEKRSFVCFVYCFCCEWTIELMWR